MLSKYIFLLFVSFSLFISHRVHASIGEINSTKQSPDYYIDTISNKNPEDSIWKPCISPFVELMGKGFFSVNADFRIRKTFSVSIGVQPSEGLMPDIMLYYFSGKRRRLEVGGGVSFGFANDFTIAGYLIHGAIGYRYQKKKGLFFRAGFTPLYVIFLDDPERSNKFYPFPGLSLGYSF